MTYLICTADTAPIKPLARTNTLLVVTYRKSGALFPSLGWKGKQVKEPLQTRDRSSWQNANSVLDTVRDAFLLKSQQKGSALEKQSELHRKQDKQPTSTLNENC